MGKQRRKPKKRNRHMNFKKCPTCGGRFPEMKYNVNMRQLGMIWAPRKDQFPGLKLCKDSFHGVGSWTNAR